jgi:small-conductance mechanosensitive channel
MHFFFRRGKFSDTIMPVKNLEPLLKNLFVPSVAAASVIVGLFIVRGVIVHFLNKWTARSGLAARAAILGSFKAPSIFWCFAIGLYFAVEFSDLPRKYVIVTDRTISILLIFSVTVAIANLAVTAFESYAQRSDINVPATGIILGVFKATIIIAGILVILNFLGISIAPLLTALGVGGLAVALALKDTLSNLFAGLHLIASKQLRPGDYIKLNSGEEGTVADITWRSTTITSPQHNTIIVPNAHIASATITNYEFPDRQMTLSVQLTVPHSADLDRVETISREAAKAVADELPGTVADEEPSVRFNGWGDNGIGFSVTVRIKDSASLYIVRHNLIKALQKRYVLEGLPLTPPVPQNAR